MVLNELESGLQPPLADHQRGAAASSYRELLAVVKQEYEDIVKNEVQRAISADEEAIAQAVRATTSTTSRPTPRRRRCKNKYTGQDEEPDERLMRSIEEKIDIPESRKDDFRREIMNYIGALALEGQAVRLPHQRAAAEGAGAEAVRGPEGLDQADQPGVDAWSTSDTQEKIDVVKGRLIKNYGYCEICATDVLNYVASIFARGDVKD